MELPFPYYHHIFTSDCDRGGDSNTENVRRPLLFSGVALLENTIAHVSKMAVGEDFASLADIMSTRLNFINYS